MAPRLDPIEALSRRANRRLLNLPEHPSDIHALFVRQKIRGNSDDGFESCPVAEYMRRGGFICGVGPQETHVFLPWKSDGLHTPIVLPNPEPIQQFIWYFDHGYYPELEDATVRPLVPAI